MEITLLNGRYTMSEAEELLKNLVKVKSDFHLAKIDTVNHTEEQIKHSETRIKQLETDLREALERIKNGGKEYIALHSKLIVEYCPVQREA